MNTNTLSKYEAELAAETRDVYQLQDDQRLDNRWGYWYGRILEDLGNVADYLRRVAHGMPDDPHYVRDKAGDLGHAALTVANRVMRPAIVCDHLIVRHEVDDDGLTYTIEDGCGLHPGHAGDHQRTEALNQLIDTADEFAKAALTASLSLLWALSRGGLDADDRNHIDERLGIANGHLQAIRHAVQRTYRAETRSQNDDP